MATNPHRAESVLVTLPNQLPPMPAVARILSRFDRAQLASFIEVAIDLADAMDGNTDAEDDYAEDSFDIPAHAVGLSAGPGCNVTDCGDTAWIEWDAMRAAQKQGQNFTAGHEDAEEDDDAGQCTEDEISTALCLKFGSGAGCDISDSDTDDDGEHPSYGIDQTQGPEPQATSADRDLMVKHRDRIRQARCVQVQSAWDGRPQFSLR